MIDQNNLHRINRRIDTLAIKGRIKQSAAREQPSKAGVYPVSITRNKIGNFVARYRFFYAFGLTAETFADTIKKALPQCKIVGYGEGWAAFRVGLPRYRQSCWWVEFSMSAMSQED